MSLENFIEIENVEKVIKTLKNGPDFGIHGAKHGNLNSILQEAKRKHFLWGHYFGVDEDAKKLPDDEFYRKLCSSVSYSIDRSGVGFDGDVIFGIPTLILAVDTGRFKDNLKPITPNTTPQGSYCGDTFSIGHDFYICKGLDICLLHINTKELRTIEKKLIRFPSDDTLGKSYFVLGKMTEKMIKKIYDKIKRYSNREEN